MAAKAGRELQPTGTITDAHVAALWSPGPGEEPTRATIAELRAKFAAGLASLEALASGLSGKAELGHGHNDATGSASGFMPSAAVTKLAGIEAGATADQTAGEIQTAYDSQVPLATSLEMQAGSQTAARRMAPSHIAIAIAALAAGGSGASLPGLYLPTGAVHNGTTDDRAAYQTAIDTAFAAGGGLVWCQPGKVARVSDALQNKAGVTLWCPSPHTFELKPDLTKSGVVLNGSRSGVIGLKISVDNRNGEEAIAWNGSNLTDVTVEHNWLFGNPAGHALPADSKFRGRAFRVDDIGARRIGFRHNRVEYFKYGFIADLNSIDTGDAVDGSSQAKGIKYVWIEDNHFVNISGDGIELNSPDTLDTAGLPICSDAWILNNHIEVPPGVASDAETLDGAGFGVGVAKWDKVKVAGNTIHARSQAIHFEDKCKRAQVVDNPVLAHYTTTQGANAVNIIHMMDCDYFTIASNFLIGGGISTSEYGINIAYTTGQKCRYGLVFNNTVSGHGGIGIFFGTVSVQEFVSRTFEGNTVIGGDRGLKTSGTGMGDAVVANKFIGTTGDAIRIGSDSLTPARMAGNWISRCGGLYLNDGTSRHFVRGISVHDEVTATTGTPGFSAWKNIARLGSSAKITFRIEISAAYGVVNRYEAEVSFIWDGTTLTPTVDQDWTSGTSLQTPEFQVVSGVLQTRVKTAAASSSLYAIVAEYVSGRAVI